MKKYTISEINEDKIPVAHKDDSVESTTSAQSAFQKERAAIVLLVASKCTSRKQQTSWVTEYFRLRKDDKSKKSIGLFWQRKLAYALASDQKKEFEKKIETSQKNTHILTFLDESYPKALFELDDIPLVLFIKSNRSLAECVKLLESSMLAVVGTRRITGYGTLVTKKILSEFEQILQAKIPIISGFMYGVDQLAHQVALDSGVPTIAVLAHGVDAILPRDIRLLENILQSGGVIVSEYAPWESAAKWTFIERNRIVAALSTVILVPEAAAKSGSMHTVSFGLDLGKSIAAVPGPITSPYSDGTRLLLNEGATLVATGEDLTKIFSEVSDDNFYEPLTRDETTIPDSDTPQEERILFLLRTQPLSTEQLSENTKIPLKDMLCELSNLELTKKIQKKGNVWMLQYHLRSG